jgi:hypothetical protein
MNNPGEKLEIGERDSILQSVLILLGVVVVLFGTLIKTGMYARACVCVCVYFPAHRSSFLCVCTHARTGFYLNKLVGWVLMATYVAFVTYSLAAHSGGDDD